MTITKFLIAWLLLLSKSFIWVMHAELIRSCCVFQNLRFTFYLGVLCTLCFVMLATSSSLSLTPLTYLAGRL